MISKRRDDKGRVLQQGEWQEPSGRYRYKYTDSLGKRKILYSWRLTEADKMPEGKRADLSLREKERKVQSLQMQGITGSNITVLELVERYLSLKTGVKHNTLANYKFVVNVLKKEEFAYKKVDDVKLSDAKIFLIKLQRDGRGYSSIHSIRGVLRPAFQMAVDDDLILKNPFGFELGTVLVNDSQKRHAVSPEDEAKFLEFVKNDPHYNQYYDAFYILFKTGLRISEFCGLTVKDLDFKEDIINVNHQLQRTREMKYIIVSTKTTSGTRLLPMESDVKEAFLRILKNRRKPKREPMVDGYGGFLFLDKNGRPMVALHWEKYMQHAREKYNREHLLHWASCGNSGQNYVIEGTLPSVKYDGEWIYLVPMENAPGRVDSVKITNASFSFSGQGVLQRASPMPQSSLCRLHWQRPRPIWPSTGELPCRPAQ